MFKKPFKAKPQKLLSSSERKKLSADIATAFDLPTGVLAELVPKDAPLKTCRITDHVGGTATLVLGAGDTPWWLRLDQGDQLVPTLYTLLRFPAMLPVLRTNDHVLGKLSGGADLMLPGVSVDSILAVKSLEAGALVAIAKEPGSPWAVGRLASSGLELSAQEGGKAAITIHAREDHLWKHGSGQDPTPIHTAGSDGTGDTTGPSEAPAQPVGPNDPGGPAEAKAQEKLDPADADRHLHNALCLLLSRQPDVPLPQPASAFYSAYVLPLRPAVAPNLTVKDSSHRSLAKWMKALTKSGLLSAKEERKGGELMVLSVNTKHPDVLGVPRFRTVEDDLKEQRKFKAVAAAEDAETAGAPCTVEEIYRVPKRGVEWFGLAQLDAEQAYSAADVRQALIQYVTRQALADPQDQKYIIPDDALRELLGPDRTRTTRQLAFLAVLGRMDRYWRMERQGQSPVEGKGDPPRVQMATKKRAGKLVTLVSGLEPFGIDPGALAGHLQHLCAGSATVQPLPGASPKKQLREVVVQGPQIATVTAYLVKEQGVPKQCIAAAQ